MSVFTRAFLFIRSLRRSLSTEFAVVRSVVMAKKIFSGSQGAGLDPLFYGPNDQLLRSSSELTVFSCPLKQLPMSVRTFSQVVPVFMQSRQADVASVTSGSQSLYPAGKATLEFEVRRCISTEMERDGLFRCNKPLF